MTTQANLDWLIWSADVDTREQLFGNLALVPRLKGVKIDRLGQETMGPEVIDELVERGYRVFDDAQLVEISVKLEALARRHVKRRPWMLNCMAGSQSNRQLEGKDIEGLKRFADVCNDAGVLSCGVTVLTSKPVIVVWDEFGRGPLDQVLYYTEALVRCGFTDVVCSPQEALAIIGRFDITTNCPGIRMPDSPPDDQARTMTPVQARHVAKRQVVGRPLTTGDIVGNLVALEANYFSAAA